MSFRGACSRIRSKAAAELSHPCRGRAGVEREDIDEVKNRPAEAIRREHAGMPREGVP